MWINSLQLPFELSMCEEGEGRRERGGGRKVGREGGRKGQEGRDREREEDFEGQDGRDR